MKTATNLLRRYRALFAGVVILCVLLVVANSLIPGYLRPWHVLLLTQEASLLGIVSVGQTLVILTGGIDLSVGQNMLLTNVIAAKMFNGKERVWPYIICLLLSAGIGLLNGLGIVYFHIPPIIMTLGTMVFLQGMVYLYTGGLPVGKASPFLHLIGVGKLGPIPILSLIWLGISVIAAVLIKLSVFGSEMYATGANPIAARIGGIRVSRVRILVYCLSGAFAGLAGLLQVGFSGYAARITVGYELETIAAVLVGGTLFTGAKGSIEQTIIGAFLITVINSILTCYVKGVAGVYIGQGLLILLVVALFTKLQRRG